jgi:hypothetical protein
VRQRNPPQRQSLGSDPPRGILDAWKAKFLLIAQANAGDR